MPRWLRARSDDCEGKNIIAIAKRADEAIYGIPPTRFLEPMLRTGFARYSSQFSSWLDRSITRSSIAFVVSLEECKLGFILQDLPASLRKLDHKVFVSVR